MDLIYGIPLSDLDKWKKNIEIALSFQPNHISSYALTIEPKTVLSHQVKNEEVKILDEDKVFFSKKDTSSPPREKTKGSPPLIRTRK